MKKLLHTLITKEHSLGHWLQSLRLTILFNNGFSIMELVMSLLIISVLTAIALPQYQKAAARTRITQAIIASKALWEAEQDYYAANESYTNDGRNLAISYPCINNECDTLRMGDNGSCQLIIATNDLDSRVNCSGSNNLISFQRYLARNRIMCCAYSKSNFVADSFCQLETGSSKAENWCGTTNPCKCYQNN